MKHKIPLSLRSVRYPILLAAVLFVSATATAAQVHFKINLDPAVSGNGALSGRLLIFMKKDDGQPPAVFGPDFSNPNAVFVSGTEITNLTSTKDVAIDADQDAFPAVFSGAPEGDYLAYALLDRDHSYTYFTGAGEGDIYSRVVKIHMPSSQADLTLYATLLDQPHSVPTNARLIEFVSPMLSAFWGRPMKMEATVVLPPDYDTSKTQRYPTVYNVAGYGGTHLGGLRTAAALAKDMADGKTPEMIYVYLEAHCSLGHHVFADSANNGPWGTALEKEFIPYLEKQFRMDARPTGRFLTGHSSGGWSTLWVMITHPDFFGGTWSTSPDPVDSRNFTGPDITKYPPQNIYTDAAGKEYNLVRAGPIPIMSIRQYAQLEHVLGYYGGQFASFNAVFSPKGPDGQPMSLADFETGRIDPFVQKAWEKYDISRILHNNWKTLGPKLKGKIHIVVGTADTFHLNEAVGLLDGELKKLGSDAKIEYIEGRDHFNLYNGGLRERIAKEMYVVARPGAKAAPR
jgi:S-formylglutathione hydrolase FrmB